jgi:HAMP domain-containing protein
MFLRKPVLFFVVAALLFAARGALEHPISHLGEAVHAAAQGADDDRQPDGAHHCDLCVAFSAIASLADGAALPSIDACVALRIGAAAAGELLLRAPPPFHSQAPPILS